MDDYLREITEPSDEIKKEALKYPNRYIFILDKEFEDEEDVPTDRILGAWKVNEEGIIVGPFLLNPNYRNRLS